MFTVTDVVPPKQRIGDALALVLLASRAAGWVIVTDAVVSQSLASVTVTE